LAIGLDREFIDDSCPADLEPYVKAHKIKMHEIDSQNWQLGLYFMRAMAVCFNFSKEKIEYFERPILEQIEYEQSAEYKKAMQEKLFASLKLMQANFERNKKEKGR
jgi:hypothetical protein